MPLERRRLPRSQTQLRGFEQSGPAQGGPAELRFYGNQTRRRGSERGGFERHGIVSRRSTVGEIAQDNSTRHRSPPSQSSRRGFFRLGSGAGQLSRNRFDRCETGWRGSEQRRRSRQ